MSREVRIKKGDIEISIPFENANDLEKKLSDYNDILKVIQKKLGVSIEDTRKIRKDLEGICDFQNNKIILLKAPSLKTKKVCLVVYAYGPIGATTEEIALSSGVKYPTKAVIATGGARKYFSKIAKDRYGLSDVGISFVTEKILPELK